MSDRPKLPVRQDSAEPNSVQMNAPSWVRSKVNEIDSNAALAAELVNTKRMENNVRFQAAQAASTVAADRLANIDGELEQIRADMAVRLAETKVQGKRALQEAGALIAAYEKTAEENEAGKAEAAVRRRIAEKELERLNKQDDNSPETIERYKEIERTIRAGLIEIDEKISILNSPASENDEGAQPKLRLLRGEKVGLQERLTKVARLLDRAMGLD